MPLNIAQYVEPSSTAILVSECQEAVLGEQSPLQGLAESARSGKLAHNLAGLLDCARKYQVTIIHCLVERRADGFGDSLNTPLTAMMARHGGPGSGMAIGSTGAQPIAPLTPKPEDIVVRRAHGITAFHETGLDHLLRNSGIKNVVFTGVSLNLAVFGGTLEAVNRGYRVVIPGDCVAADPPDYATQLLNNSLRNMAYITDSKDIIEAWNLAGC